MRVAVEEQLQLLAIARERHDVVAHALDRRVGALAEIGGVSRREQEPLWRQRQRLVEVSDVVRRAGAPARAGLTRGDAVGDHGDAGGGPLRRAPEPLLTL